MESVDDWETRTNKSINCYVANSCNSNWSLPQPGRPKDPVSYKRHELLECFPCYYESTWPLEKLPFLKWLLNYKLKWLFSDILAGLTVGLMVIPQALAYANIANLPPGYGLYSAFMGCFVYVLFGTCKDITLGPTAILSLVTASITDNCVQDPEQYDRRISCAITLTFFSGVIQFALGLLNLGFLVDFIPTPIISGFTSAAALTIALGQVKHLLGISAGRDVISALGDIFTNIKHTKKWDLVLGLCCIVLLVLLKLLKMLVDRYMAKNKGRLRWPVVVVCKALWLLSTARNAVVVFLAGMVGFLLSQQDWFDKQITLISYNNTALPSFHVPSPTAETCKNLGIGILVAPLIGFLESVAIAKAFAKKNGYKVEPSQELVALGLCNLASSFVGSYPVTGSFSRTAVNAQSGVKTPAAGIITAIDVVPLVVSFFLTLFLGIEYGVPVAVLVYILFLLYRHARPRHEIHVLGQVVIVTLNGGWTYPGVHYIMKRVTMEVTSTEDCPDRERTAVLVFDCASMPDIDYTVVQEFSQLCEELHKVKVKVCIAGAQDQVASILQKARIRHLYFSNSMAEVMSVTGLNQEDESAHLLRGNT